MTTPDLLNMSFGAILAFVRMAGAIMLLPGMGEISVPPMIRLGLALAVTAIVAPLVGSVLPHYPRSVVILAALLFKEGLVGVTLGWITRTIVLALPMAAQIISYQIGLSSVLLPNAELGPSSTIVSNALNLAVPALVLGSGLFVVPMMALTSSFHLIPPGLETVGAHQPDAGALIRMIILTVSRGFAVAMQLAAPFLVTGLIWQTGLALMAKAAPQIQVYFVAAPVQIIGGLLLLAATVIPMISIWERLDVHYLTTVAGF